MENKSMIPRENENNEPGKSEEFETEVNRMDYEGGNYGEDCANKGENGRLKDERTRPENPLEDRPGPPADVRQ
jgi:hypothetical protein